MANFAATPEAIAGFGQVQTAVAGERIAAGSMNIATIAATMTPVFGLLGTEHLIATIMAMTTNSFEVGQLAAVHAAHGATIAGSVAKYVANEAHSATEVANIGKLL